MGTGFSTLQRSSGLENPRFGQVRHVDFDSIKYFYFLHSKTILILICWIRLFNPRLFYTCLFIWKPKWKWVDSLFTSSLSARNHGQNVETQLKTEVSLASIYSSLYELWDGHPNNRDTTWPYYEMNIRLGI